jgi:23S rRNA pseudouridine2457 synthase
MSDVIDIIKVIAMKKIYIAFYKPFGVLSQFTGDIGQRTLSEFGLPPNVYPVGRLDKDSEGLLLLTNDGPFKHQLLNPKSNHQKTYWVQVEGEPSNEELHLLEVGVVIKGYKTKSCSVRNLNGEPKLPLREPPIRVRKTIPTSWIEVVLTEGKNRQVRRMTAKIGCPTLRLVRISIEAISLAELEPGKWRYVQKDEIVKK